MDVQLLVGTKSVWKLHSLTKQFFSGLTKMAKLKFRSFRNPHTLIEISKTVARSSFRFFFRSNTFALNSWWSYSKLFLFLKGLLRLIENIFHLLGPNERQHTYLQSEKVLHRNHLQRQFNNPSGIWAQVPLALIDWRRVKDSFVLRTGPTPDSSLELELRLLIPWKNERVWYWVSNLQDFSQIYALNEQGKRLNLNLSSFF